MKARGQSKMDTLRWQHTLLCLVFLCLAGCTGDRVLVGKSLLADAPAPEETSLVARGYRVCCPDVIEVSVAHRPDLHWTAAVDVEGAYPIENLGRPRVEGRGVDDIAHLVAVRLGLDDAEVAARVTEYRSKRIYVFGEIKNAPQAVPYRGPETVLDLLQRVGGITPGADPGAVYVVRSNIGDGKRPEVFHVDLRAIVVKKDLSTNIRLEPFDQVHIGATRQALVERCIPPWMRPFHWALWDTRPEDKPPALRQRLRDARSEAAESR